MNRDRPAALRGGGAMAVLSIVIPDLIRDPELQAAVFAALDAGSSPA
jgi:hypothetical protein